MAAKTLRRDEANCAGIWGSNGASFSSRNPSIRQSNVRAVRSTGPPTLVDVASVEVEGRARLQEGEEPLLGLVGDLEPDRRAPLSLAESLLDGREQAALDLGLLDREVAVPGHAERRPSRHAEAAEERIEPRADDLLEQDEPPLAVAQLGQGHQPAQDRRHLEHGVELARRVLVLGLDPQDQVQALVVQVRERVRRVDRQRREDRVDLAVEVLVEIGVCWSGVRSSLSQRRMPWSASAGRDLLVPGVVLAGDEVVGAPGDLVELGRAGPCRRAAGPGARGRRRAGPGARRRGPRRTRRGSTPRSPGTGAARAAGPTGRAPPRARAR